MKKQAEKKRTTMSLSLSIEDKQFLKVYAAEKGVTVAAVVHDMVEVLKKERVENGR